MTCSVVDGQGQRGNVHIPAIMSVDFPDVLFEGFVGANRTPDRDKKIKSRNRYQTENEKERFVYVPGRGAVHKKNSVSRASCCCACGLASVVTVAAGRLHSVICFSHDACTAVRVRTYW